MAKTLSVVYLSYDTLVTQVRLGTPQTADLEVEQPELVVNFSGNDLLFSLLKTSYRKEKCHATTLARE